MRLDVPSVKVQVGLVPLHEGPPHPANEEVASGIAVNVIVCPSLSPTGGVQSEKQVNSIGAATLPPPGPPKNIESVVGSAGLILPGVGLPSSSFLRSSITERGTDKV